MLAVNDLRVALDGEAGVVRAIDGLALAIDRGQTFALVGESGCGKSMTALALLRLLPENGQVTSGQVRLEEQDLLDLPESAMRPLRGRRIAMIFQEPGTSLNPVLTVGQQIVEAIETHTILRGAEARAKAVDWLRRVGIPEPEARIDDYPFRLSGGQKQRVMIAIALAGEPGLLVADEPTTALDVTIQAQILDLLRQLQAETGMAMLLITHDLAVVSGMAHTVALMYAGQIVEVAPAAAFFATPRHPYAQALLRALPDAGRRGEPLAAIEGTVPALTGLFRGCRFAPRCDRAQERCGTQLPPVLPIGPPGKAAQVRCWLHAGDARAEPGGQGAASALSPAPPPARRGPDGASAVAASAGTPAPLLQVRDLSVRFPVRQGVMQRVVRHFEAVRQVSFEIAAGRTLALVGESGCGKTTTGKAIVQLLRRQATITGQALFKGRDLFGLQGADLAAARREVQIVFQDPFASLDPRMRVMEILEEGLVSLRPDLAPTQRRQQLDDLVRRVGLRPDALERFPHEFSGGQRQRIAIARALAVQPRLVVCDEPTSALDVSVQAQILNLLKDLQREYGLAYLFITHNIGVVEYLADQVVVMRAGEIVEAGTASAVLVQPREAYTRSLLQAVPRLAVPTSLHEGSSGIRERHDVK